MSIISLNVTQTGNNKDDVLYGDSRNDIIDAGNGNNIVYASEGENVITAGSGNDIIYGDSGRDIINSGDGNNNVYAGEGDNRVTTGAGKDAIYTGAGSDVISSGAGDDLIQAGEGKNIIDAGTGIVRVFAGRGSDVFKLNKGDGFASINGVESNDDISLPGQVKDYTYQVEDNKFKIFTKEGDLLAVIEGVQQLQPEGVQEAGQFVISSAISERGFDREIYLLDNPEVSQLITEGKYNSALDHFLKVGQFNRKAAYFTGAEKGDAVFLQEALTNSDDTVIGLGKINKITGVGLKVINGVISPRSTGEGQKDTLVGGDSSKNEFILGNLKDGKKFYVGKNDNDFALVQNFNLRDDKLTVAGKAEDYKIESVNGNQRISTQNNDLIALVEGVTDLRAYAGVNPSGGTYVVSKESDLISKLIRVAQTDVFNLKDGDSKPKLQVSITGHSSNQVNELGIFIVDDATGKIDGITPGAAGYAQAALKRSQVILSVISNAPTNFKQEELKRSLEFTNDNHLRFYLVKNSTNDSVLSGKTPISSVLFSDPNNQKIGVSADGSFSLGWKDASGNNADFNNLVVKIQPSDQPLELGTSLQGKKEGEVLDLRDITGTVKANFTVKREAAFNNLVGFYKVVDEFGGIDTNGDGKADTLPGQAGYTQAAMRGRIEGIDLRVNNQGTATFNDKSLTGGTILAPFIITNGGTANQVLAGQTNEVYFAYLGANPDKVDHIRLLGNNTFGFEDISGGGDLDFNDIIVQVSLNK